MIAVDETALMCDLAETYHIYDYKSLPASLVAAFSVGLRADSRIKLKLHNMNCPMQDILLAGILDKLSLLVWMQTKDGYEGANRPESVVSKLLGEEEKGDDVAGFSTHEDFEKEWKRITEGGEAIGN